jgi:hypothetical protein
VNFSVYQARKIQAGANRRKFKDAELQRSTIMGDEHGHWLTEQIQRLHVDDTMLQTHQPKRFSFLGDDGEAVLADIESSRAGLVILMPSGCKVYRVHGNDFSSWLFCVEEFAGGNRRRSFNVAYRRIDSGAYLLYLRDYLPIR